MKKIYIIPTSTISQIEEETLIATSLSKYESGGSTQLTKEEYDSDLSEDIWGEHEW